ncbi:MAG: hypothetical protein AUJ21_05315 [Anaerolineae bacterium CG1_02_58_13]|nr:MAG: hypothetical protein AUJ21_05315 [Anaerolineae bacterium CG1_02_58_13]
MEVISKIFAVLNGATSALRGAQSKDGFLRQVLSCGLALRLREYPPLRAADWWLPLRAVG